jgi:hypothetical protein
MWAGSTKFGVLMRLAGWAKNEMRWRGGGGGGVKEWKIIV